MYILSSVNKCPTYQKIYWFSDMNLLHPTTEIMWFNIPWYWFIFEAQTCCREHKSGVSSKVLPLTCHIQLRSFNGLMNYYSNSRLEYCPPTHLNTGAGNAATWHVMKAALFLVTVKSSPPSKLLVESFLGAILLVGSVITETTQWQYLA